MSFGEIINRVLKYISENRGRFTGGLLGLILALLFLSIGLVKTLIILVCTACGYFLGFRWDKGTDYRKVFDKFLPDKLK
ncbi:MAG: DUF2273 domain-containing protein [Halanaerobiales bacterium]